jgi:hypothetical protein
MNMKQRNQVNSEPLSDELESTSFPLPKRYIPWIPLIGLVQVLVTITIFAAVMAPYVGHEEAIPSIRTHSPS